MPLPPRLERAERLDAEIAANLRIIRQQRRFTIEDYAWSQRAAAQDEDCRIGNPSGSRAHDKGLSGKVGL